MAFYAKDNDPAFHGAGAKAGLEIWCIQNQQLIPVPKSSYGKFYSGSAYVVLNTILPKNGPPEHDIHFWLGSDANEVDSALASDKALELDSALGSCTVQYREVQGLETEKFLSYFKPCLIPVDDVYSSEAGHIDDKTYKISLFSCKGDHGIHVKEVPFSRSSLNHNDVFVLDTASKIFLFCGCNSSIQERAKALEVVQYIKEHNHDGKCEVATIEDGKFVGDSDAGEFWSLFGGYAPIPRDAPSFFEKKNDTPSVKLYWINLQGKLCQSEADPLSKQMLHSDKCYMLDCGTEIFVWMGRRTSVTERKTSISAVENFLRTENRCTGTHLTFLTEGLESAIFRSYFQNWPQTVELGLYEEGREKVAAIFKHQGYDVKELPEEDLQPIINCRGSLKVWRVNGDDELSLLPVSKHTRFYSGDCYVVEYTYPSSGRDENLFYAWLGCESVMEERVNAVSHMIALADSIKAKPVLAQVFENKEPLQFYLILQTLVVFKGGLSKGYKKYIAEKGIFDCTYDDKRTALFRIQGTSPSNMQAIQLDNVSSSLNSSYCYILQTGTTVFSWIGNLSAVRDHDLLDRMLDLINPSWQPISLREGSEPETFWDAIGGKSEYPKEKEIKGCTEDPHLFKLTYTADDFKVREIYNFSQDDLTTEDVFVLDCCKEIYIWIGCHAKIQSKQEAFDLGLKFLERDILEEGLSPETPMYVVFEGYEPPFFTYFFDWDPLKANMHGNSFERKLAILKGKPQRIDASIRNSRKAYSQGTTPDSSRSRSVSSDGRGNHASPSPVILESNVKYSEKQGFSSPTPVARKLFSESSSYQGSDGSPLAQPSSSSEKLDPSQFDGSEATANLLLFPYERLKVTSSAPVTNIDATKREAYLSDEEFQEKFEMTRKAFYELPKWKQNKLKMSLHLF